MCVSEPSSEVKTESEKRDPLQRPANDSMIGGTGENSAHLDSVSAEDGQLNMGLSGEISGLLCTLWLQKYWNVVIISFIHISDVWNRLFISVSDLCGFAACGMLEPLVVLAQS